MRHETPPAPPAESIWSMGARKVKDAAAESGLSRQRLWALMSEGVLPYIVISDCGTRLIAWKAIVEYLESLHTEQNAGAGACT